jgi:hypothetical protein
MDRIREAEYQDLRARVDGRALRGLFFIHLRQDLPAPPIDWIDCQDPSEWFCQISGPSAGPTSYSPRRAKIRRLLTVSSGHKDAACA